LEIEKDWADILAGVASGTPGTIKGRLFSEDRSQRYKQLSESAAAIDKDYASPRLAIDGWLSRIDRKRQVLPESTVHDLRWGGSTDIPVGNFELHLTLAR
jgi:hypothetical protein